MICVVYVKSSEPDPTFLLPTTVWHAWQALAIDNISDILAALILMSYGSAASSVRLSFSACRSSTNSTQITPSVYTPAPYGPFDSDISSVHLDLYHRELKLCVFVILVQVERFFDDSRHLPRYLADRSRQTLGS